MRLTKLRNGSNAKPKLVDGAHLMPFRGGLVFKAHRLVYHSTLGLRVIKKKKVENSLDDIGEVGERGDVVDHQQQVAHLRHTFSI